MKRHFERLPYNRCARVVKRSEDYGGGDRPHSVAEALCTKANTPSCPIFILIIYEHKKMI